MKIRGIEMETDWQIMDEQDLRAILGGGGEHPSPPPDNP